MSVSNTFPIASLFREFLAGDGFVEVEKDAGEEEESVGRVFGHEFDEAVALDVGGVFGFRYLSKAKSQRRGIREYDDCPVTETTKVTEKRRKC